MSARSHLARVERLGPSFDLLAAYGRDGVFLERQGLGVAGEASSLRYHFAHSGPR